MINRVVLVGRLTKDPELRYTQNGNSVANFTLAVNRKFKQDGGQEADFINCQVWNKTAENTANYLRKGSLAGVEGRIQTRSYDNQEGKRVYITEVVADGIQFLGSKNANTGDLNQNNINAHEVDKNGYSISKNTSQVYSSPYGIGSSRNMSINDDDLPF